MKVQVEVAERKFVVAEEAGTRYFTEVTEKQTWLEGQYAGKSYRVTSLYVFNAPGHRGQYLKSSSAPWGED